MSQTTTLGGSANAILTPDSPLYATRTSTPAPTWRNRASESAVSITSSITRTETGGAAVELSFMEIRRGRMGAGGHQHHSPPPPTAIGVRSVGNRPAGNFSLETPPPCFA